MPGRLVALEYLLGKQAVLVRVGGVIVVETNPETGEVRLVLAGRGGDQGLGRDALLAGAQHDGGAMGVIGAHVAAVMAAQFLESDPDVRLDVLHQVANMDRPVGIGQGAGDQNCAFFLTHSRVSG